MRIINSMEQLSELMQRHNLLEEGTLRIGMLFIGGYVNLFQILKDYRLHYPGMDYRLTIDGSAALLNQLLNRSIHASFLIGSENQLKAHEDDDHRDDESGDVFDAAVAEWVVFVGGLVGHFEAD